MAQQNGEPVMRRYASSHIVSQPLWGARQGCVLPNRTCTLFILFYLHFLFSFISALPILPTHVIVLQIMHFLRPLSCDLRPWFAGTTGTLRHSLHWRGRSENAN